MAVIVCKHNQRGFCRYGDRCRQRHVNESCGTSDCQDESCLLRHPYKCRYFYLYGNCKFGDGCAYVHRETEDKVKIKCLEKKLSMFEAKVILLERSVYELVVKLDTFMCMEREESIDVLTEEDSHIGQFDGNETVSEEEISSMAGPDGIDDDKLDNVLLNLPWWWKTKRKLKSEEFKVQRSCSSSCYSPREESSSVYETANEEEIASMTEADGIDDDDNSDNVGQPVSAMESEDSDGDREAFWYPELLELQCREDDYDYDYITDYIERAIEKKQAKIQKHKILIYEWKRQKTSFFS